MKSVRWAVKRAKFSTAPGRGWQDENACTTSELRGFSGGAYTGEDSVNSANLGKGKCARTRVRATRRFRPKENPSGGSKTVSRSRAPEKSGATGGPPSGGGSRRVSRARESADVVAATGSSAADDYGED